jgi:hypothetical protein
VTLMKYDGGPDVWGMIGFGMMGFDLKDGV